MSNWVSYYRNEGEEEEEEEEAAENAGNTHFQGLHMLLICQIEICN